MAMLNLKGTGVAVVTPFKKDGSIDFPALKKIINFQIDNKVEYLVALGTNGEPATLSQDEKNEIIDFFIETVDERIPLVIGFSSNCTCRVTDSIKQTYFKHISAVMSVAPYYNQPSQEGIYQHYKMIAETSPVPVILYNVPARAVVNITAKTALRLAHEVPNIVAIKETSGDFTEIMEIIANKPANFHVLSGFDAFTLPLIYSGASGAISGIANAFPFEVSEMVRRALANDTAEAQKLHYKLFPFFQAVIQEGSPSGLKSLMSQMGLLENNFRLPMTPVSEANHKAIAELLKK